MMSSGLQVRGRTWRTSTGVRVARLDKAWRYLVGAFVALALLFLLAPIIVVFFTSLNRQSVSFPPSDWSLSSYGQIPGHIFTALGTSVKVALISVSLSILLTIPLSIALVRGTIPGRAIFEAWFRSPLQVPGIVLGVALYQYYILLNGTGVTLRGSLTGLVIAHILIITPFILTAIVARLSVMNRDLEEAAFGLGASFWRVMWQVMIPLMRPALISGAFLGFLVSFDDVPVSLFLVGAGNNTLPVVMLADATQTLAPWLYAISSVLVGLSVVVCLLINRVFGLRTVMSGGS